ncbi:PREDICTED: 46 kDa FK506-binding nuclear protein-like isoform X2 [Nicrophorus vespilloides]|uniref:FK506-binding protein n=1 Tax=Nicrophorus vespilloides TaxID=110193 RepID=A0ABM1NJH3_NICVS|nr:PREDICTED: 46 kDa FK506-binding nuclear protein-like isoform X2 [Nicrophorus vespilloides]
MFWGLIMEPQKRYSQTVHRSFHISMAALDLCSCTDEPVQVMCGFENRKYLLCTLQKDKILQVPLDVNFEVGDQISFITNGESHVHLTGYLNEDFNLDEEDIEEEEDDDEQELDVSQSNIVSGKRAKKMCSNSLQPPAKKSKTMQLLDSVNSQDDDDSDDSDVNLSDILNEDDDEDEDESNVQEEGEEDDDDDEDGAEEEDDDEDGAEEDDDDDEEEEEEDDDDDDDDEEEDVKPKMNGTAKDAKKNKVAEVTGKKQKEQQVKQEKNQQQQQEKKGDKKQQQQQEKKEVAQKKKIEGGVLIEDMKVGNGKVAQKGKTVQVYYEGRFKTNNKVFDSTTKGAGFKFRLGKQEVIKGWDAGVAGMKVGGKRRIVCPPHMAYGPKGSPPVIPPNSTLVFEVELKNVH